MSAPYIIFSAEIPSSQKLIGHEEITEEKAQKIYEIYASQVRNKSHFELLVLLEQKNTYHYRMSQEQQNEERLKIIALLFGLNNNDINKKILFGSMIILILFEIIFSKITHNKLKTLTFEFFIIFLFYAIGIKLYQCCSK